MCSCYTVANNSEGTFVASSMVLGYIRTVRESPSVLHILPKWEQGNTCILKCASYFWFKNIECYTLTVINSQTLKFRNVLTQGVH